MFRKYLQRKKKVKIRKVLLKKMKRKFNKPKVKNIVIIPLNKFL